MFRNKKVILALILVVAASGCTNFIDSSNIDRIWMGVCDKNLPGYPTKVEVEGLYSENGMRFVALNTDQEINITRYPHGHQVHPPKYRDEVNIEKRHEEMVFQVHLLNMTKFKAENEEYSRLRHRLPENLSSRYYSKVCDKQGIPESGNVSCSINPEKIHDGMEYQISSDVYVQKCGSDPINGGMPIDPIPIYNIGETFENNKISLTVHDHWTEEAEKGWKRSTFNLTLKNKNVSIKEKEEGIHQDYILVDGKNQELGRLNGPNDLLRGYSETMRTSRKIRGDQKPKYLIAGRVTEKKPVVAYRLN